MAKQVDLTGQKLHRWTILKRDGHIGVKTAWLCLCDCGKNVRVQTDSLTMGKSKSCGCLHIDTITKHNKSRTKTYRCWLTMKSRCFNKKTISFHRYGGRGITVCKRWMNFDNFFSDVGDCPSPKHSIDRIDCNKGYSPDNCRWATIKEQAANKRTVKLYSHNGKTMHVVDWAKHLGIPDCTLRNRLKAGLTFEEAISHPTKTPFKRATEQAPTQNHH